MARNPENPLAQFLSPEDLSAISQPGRVPEGAAQALGGIGLGGSDVSKRALTGEGTPEKNLREVDFESHIKEQLEVANRLFGEMVDFTVPTLEIIRGADSTNLEMLEKAYRGYSVNDMNPRFVLAPFNCDYRQVWQPIYKKIGYNLSTAAGTTSREVEHYMWHGNPLLTTEDVYSGRVRTVKWSAAVVPEQIEKDIQGYYNYEHSARLIKPQRKALSEAGVIGDCSHMSLSTYLALMATNLYLFDNDKLSHECIWTLGTANKALPSNIMAKRALAGSLTERGVVLGEELAGSKTASLRMAIYAEPLK